jgi:hypothetical protein
MTFDPQAHLIQLPRRVKDPQTGQWSVRQDEYLEVKWRLCWFREQYPHGTIDTQFLRLDWEQGIAICQCTVSDGEGGKSTATGTETRKSFEDFVEKSETRSVGRALALLGFGTQFVGEDLSEGEHVADAPVSHRDAPDAAHETTGISHPLPVGEDGTAGAAITPAPATKAPATNGHRPAQDPDEALAYPTEGHIAALSNLALTECQEDKEVFDQRIRQTMGLKADASVAPRLLTRTMTMAQYMDIFAYYRRLESQLAKGKGASRAEDSTPQPTPQPTAATPEVPPTVPSVGTSASVSAPSPDDATERDRVRLRAEVAQWDLRVAPEEVEHVIVHNPYSKARALLWKCRRPTPAATPIESAAD